MSLKTYTHLPKSGAKPTSMVICLHGLGANGMDLLGLAREWEHELTETVFISPDAPFPCDMAPVGYQWFSLQDRNPAAMLEGIKEAEPILQAYIDAMLKEYGIADDKLALVGFSQGTMMSLYAAPRRTKKIAGVLGYSGALLGEEGLGAEGINKMPVYLAHGESDTVVPFDAYRHASSHLAQNGFPIQGHTTPGLQHSIDQTGIDRGLSFLSKILA